MSAYCRLAELILDHAFTSLVVPDQPRNVRDYAFVRPHPALEVRSAVVLEEQGDDSGRHSLLPVNRHRIDAQRDSRRNRTAVMTAETSKEPRQPMRLLKNRNIVAPSGSWRWFLSLPCPVGRVPCL